MKIGGVYILSRRSILRILATITAALMSVSSAATIRRIHDTAISLHSLDRQIVGRQVRTVVPDIMYLEYKALYLELKSSDEVPPLVAPAHRTRPVQAAAAPCSNVRDARFSKAATKADLRAAVKTILRGEDISAAKPGPRITPAKLRQIEAAKSYRATHCGCTLHNACIRSFVPAKGGYKSVKSMYEHLRLLLNDT